MGVTRNQIHAMRHVPLFIVNSGGGSLRFHSETTSNFFAKHIVDTLDKHGYGKIDNNIFTLTKKGKVELENFDSTPNRSMFEFIITFKKMDY